MGEHQSEPEALGGAPTSVHASFSMFQATGEGDTHEENHGSAAANSKSQEPTCLPISEGWSISCEDFHRSHFPDHLPEPQCSLAKGCAFQVLSNGVCPPSLSVPTQGHVPPTCS